MRKREREQVAEVARRRLEQLSAELAGLRPEQPVEPVPSETVPVRTEPVEEYRDPWQPGSFLEEPRPVLAGPPGGLPAGPREVAQPGRHAGDRFGGLAVRGWVGDRMPDSLRGRVALTSQHTAVVVAVVGVALALAGWLALRSGAQDDAVPQARFVVSTASPSAAPQGAPSGAVPAGAGPVAGTPAATGSPAVVVVDVAGKVRHPGIVTLPVGSRVHDALKKAGGARPGTRLAALNLARVLVDGEQVVVGQPAPTGTAPSAVGSTPGSAGGMVNLNSAGLSELDMLPGVGPVTAQKILDWRGAHGAFSSVDELLEVDGIGDKTLADIAPHVTL